MAAPLEFDVLIVGAGVSGIGAAYHLMHKCPATRFAIIEGRKDLGGTWDLFRYPGIRSDSDLFTFGYDFKPWDSSVSIADGPAIKAYLAETVKENNIDQHIRFEHRVEDLHWSSATHRWTVKVRNVVTDTVENYTCKWFFCGAGYYRYEEGYTPEFKGRERFKGQTIHPQHWPENLDYTGKRVVVIGSGATAVTLLPAMADKTAHITMLQRTPTYIMPVPYKDPLAEFLRAAVGKRWAHDLTRKKNILMQRYVYQFCQSYPKAARKIIRYYNARYLPADYPVDVHFNPPYNPWDQRLCAVPDADLFRALRKGKCSIVTDKIRTFTETGIELESGQTLDADIIVTATGLNVQLLGGIPIYVNDKRVNLSDSVVYKGMMLSGVPNFAMAVGYTASSWTLKVGLLCEHFCRLLQFMDSKGYDSCVPTADPSMPTFPLLDFGAGYIQRAIGGMPKRGDKFPWTMGWNYFADVEVFRKGEVNDPALKFDTPVTKVQQAA